MKQVLYHRCGGPEVLEMAEVPPPPCGPGEVRVRMHAASVNPVDAKIREGAIPILMPEFPAGSGRDGAGVVTEVGEGVPPDLMGKRVCFLCPRGLGSWAEEVVIPAELVEEVPEALSMTEAASLPLGAISAWIALMQTARVGQGDRVLIHAAAGGVGSIAVQIARAQGAVVTGTCSARNADFVRALGADAVVAYDEADFADGVRDQDIVLDVMGGDVHERSYAVLKPGGTLVWLVAAPFDAGGKPDHVNDVMAEILPGRGGLAEVLDLVAQGKVRPVVEEVLPFTDFAEAYRRIATGHARGKLVLILP